MVFIDTGYHFPETLETVEMVRRRYGLNLRMMTVPHHDEELWKVDPENCCSAVKVGQLDRALEGKAAWMSGLRRPRPPPAARRRSSPATCAGLVKVNPLATWTEQDVEGYIADHDVIVNPLQAQGYLSIGCQPCTHLPTDPNDPRRAAGSAATRRSAASTTEVPPRLASRAALHPPPPPSWRRLRHSKVPSQWWRTRRRSSRRCPSSSWARG